jgi:YfiR/HmsC-like
LSTKTKAKTGELLEETHSWSFRPTQVSLHALRSLLFVAVVFHRVAAGSAWAQPGSDEDQMKAAFLFHFAQLVEWPADAFDRSDSSLFLCTLEDDAFFDELENTVEGKQIGSRTIRVRHVHFSQATRGCDMLFISKSQGKSLQLATLRDLPVLTVGESDDFLSSGGMIRFRLAEDRIRFDINLEAADSSHLKISSRLLLLANSVSRGSGMEKGR